MSALGLPVEVGGGGDLPAFLAALEVLAYHDLSLWVKFGVQFGLFAGAIQQLGTERHHQRYLAEAARLDLPGCFAMTETDHGSDVASLETTATYEVESGQFVIHTPHDGARKDFIGGAARDARLAVVFAQLRTAGETHGVHAFLVPVRRQGGTVEGGVRIEDCGHKLGLNGVDNGRLWFDGVRIPRENLLDRFASVAPDGTYTSPITGDAKRFFVTLGTLVGGRVNIAIAAGSTAKKALTIAVRYGARRRQFAPADGESAPCSITSRTSSGSCRGWPRRSRSISRCATWSRATWRRQPTAAPLDGLRPTPEVLRLLSAAVLDRWNVEQKDVIQRRRSIERRLEDLRRRKERIVEAYLYETALDKETYPRHLARVEEDLTLAELDLYDAKVDEFDIEGTLAFAEHLVSNASRLWIEAELDQRQRLQKVFFPEGVSYDGKEFRTPLTCPFFNNFEGISWQADRMVAHKGFEPLLPP